MYNLITPSLTPNQLSEMLSTLFRRSSSSTATVHSNTSETTLVSTLSSSDKMQAKQLKKQQKQEAKLAKLAEKKRRQAQRPAYQPEFTGMGMGGAGMPSMGGAFFMPPPMVATQPFADSGRASFVEARLSVASGMFSPSSPSQTALEDKFAASSVMLGGPVLAYRFSTK